MRLLGWLMLQALIVCGCSPSVLHTPSGDAGTSSAGSGGADAGVADAGVEWTHDPGQTFSSITCKEDGMLLLVEVWPTGTACTPDPAATDVLVLGIDAWDGEPHTFQLGQETPHGTAHATLGVPGPLEGTITVEPFAEAPRWISWDLSEAAGRTDLGLCGHFDDYPCPLP